MTKLLIVYHSRTGNTEAMAKAVSEGALSCGATVSLKTAVEATTDDLINCDAVVFGTATNFSYLTGVMKEFFDQVWLNISGVEGSKPYAVFTSAGGGYRTTLDVVDDMCSRFTKMQKFHLIKASEGVVATRQPSPEVLEECRELGKKMAQL